MRIWHRLWQVVGIASILAIVFNVFQIIVIIAGGYNLPEDVEPQLLAVWMSILPTVRWLIISVGGLAIAIIGMRGSHRKRS